MKILGLNFNKINVERFPQNEEKADIKISTDIGILDIKSINADIFKTKDEFLSIKFSYVINYEPKFAKIEFLGEMVVSLDPKDAKDVLKDWKEKKFSEDFKVFVFNAILRKANLKALELEDDMNLPLHMPFPMVRKESDRQ
ncbi:MAG TPA: hypothetical protein VMC80_02650 [Patescibacteria group bacterium]|nr:hypothetical protein [Patescibacteria group bacterium]